MSERVTEKPRTVCVECRWFYMSNWDGSPDCTHKPRPKAWSPVWGEYEVRKPEDRNTGNCPHFEAKL